MDKYFCQRQSACAHVHAQALTLENYDEIQFDLQRDTNFGALIFILAWVVFGYYILLVLFMAIILEAFESKYDKGALQEAYLACELHAACDSPRCTCVDTSSPVRKKLKRTVGFKV